MEISDYNRITGKIISSAFEVHSQLGPGLLESTYEECLLHELEQAGFNVSCQHHLPLSYKGVHINKAYYMDMVVEKSVVVELKSVDLVLPIHKAQLLTYLKLGNFKLGLLLNFNVMSMKEGIIRMANHL